VSRRNISRLLEFPPLLFCLGSSNVLGTESLQESRDRKSKERILHVRYRRGTKKVTLQRFLCSKLIYEAKEIKLRDILALYDNQVWLLEKEIRDPSFREKYEKTLEVLTKILREARSNINFDRAVAVLSEKIKEDLKGFTFPSRNYLPIKEKFGDAYSVHKYKEQGIPTKEIPPRPFIGVGYKDKGNYTDKAKDGSPSWQEVAKSHREHSDEYEDPEDQKEE